MAGSALFVLVFLVDGATRPGYDARQHPVSATALGRRGWVQTSSFVVNGLLVTVSAAGLPASVSPWSPPACGGWTRCGGTRLGTPPGTPETTSWAHRLLDAAGAVVFVAGHAALAA
ncbi:DUF998 domain-containing protein [Micromonospora fluostatini]|uniref:DUF998 domain-containing protein n=1 Tax=Micromonospora sp. JCM 30529 TaxID=3421643 RepID=UPI003D16EFAD